MARGWKRLAERIIARACEATQAARWARPSTVVLAYHNVVPRGESVAGDASLHVDQAAFADQLDLILEELEVVPLEEALTTPAGGRGARAVITFDDAYQGAMSAGLDEVARRGLPATVFVPPGLLGSDGFWWDRLAPAGGEPLDASVREHALSALEGKSDLILGWAAAEGLPSQELPWHARPVDPSALRPGALPAQISLGAHTWSHPNLAALAPASALAEMEASRAWLSESTDRYSDWLAYPYGLHSDATVLAAEKIFGGAVLVTGGLAERRGRRVGSAYRVPRLNVPRGLTLDGLRLRLWGLL